MFDRGKELDVQQNVTGQLNRRKQFTVSSPSSSLSLRIRTKEMKVSTLLLVTGWDLGVLVEKRHRVREEEIWLLKILWDTMRCYEMMREIEWRKQLKHIDNYTGEYYLRFNVWMSFFYSENFFFFHLSNLFNYHFFCRKGEMKEKKKKMRCSEMEDMFYGFSQKSVKEGRKEDKQGK